MTVIKQIALIKPNGGRNLESDCLKTFDEDADQAKMRNDQYDSTLFLIIKPTVKLNSRLISQPKESYHIDSDPPNMAITQECRRLFRFPVAMSYTKIS
jgi:hypothetical protein